LAKGIGGLTEGRDVLSGFPLACSGQSVAALSMSTLVSVTERVAAQGIGDQRGTVRRKPFQIYRFRVLEQTEVSGYS
jgi:hypothetical protein